MTEDGATTEIPTWAPPRIWGNVPQRNMNFTGRKEILTLLRESMKRGQGATAVTAALPGDPLLKALQGMGGVGKTAVAIEYAHRYQSDYDIIWWVQADQLTLLRSSLAGLAKPLGLEAAAAIGIEAAAAAVLDALRRGAPFRRWLLIFDNADQPEDLQDMIPGGSGHVLITSQNNRWQSVMQTVPLDVFTRQESIDFLLKRAPKALSPDDAERIADSLGDLPLALEQAGAMLAETGMPVDTYLRQLAERIEEIMAVGIPPAYGRSMTAAWMLSVDKVQQNLPQAVELLRCCAFFGQDPIPRSVFDTGMPPAGMTKIADLIADPIKLARAFRELARFALVKIDGGLLSVHRLVQALLRAELDPKDQAVYQHEVHLILAAGAPSEPTDSKTWPQYRELVPHVTSPATELAQCQNDDVRKFALNVVRYLYLSGDGKSCLALADRFIEQWTSDSGADNNRVLDAQRHRGNALRQLGQYRDAYQVIESTLARSTHTLGEKNRLTLALRNSFGADLRAYGNFAEARALDEATLALHREVFGPDDPQTLRVMNNLASDYARTSGYHQARDLHKSVYNLQLRAGTKVSATERLSSLNGLAWAVRLCGDLAEARDLGADAWDRGREELGPEHDETLRAANGLSIALRRLGVDYDTALAIATQVYEQSEKLRGESHPDTMAAAISLTNVQRAMGRTGEALDLAQATVARYPRVYGPEHPYNYGCVGNLALIRRVTGDPEEARRLDQAALDGLDKRLTRNHHYSLTVATNLASDLAALNDVVGARALSEQTFTRLRDLLGPDDLMTLGCAANLVLDRRADGAEEEADQLAAETLSSYAARLGAEHPDVEAVAAGQRLDFDFDPLPI